MKRSNSNVALTVAVFLLGVAGCGGGGGGSSSGGSPATPAPSAWSGVKQVGVAGELTYGRGVAVDNSGNVFVTGRSEGNLDGNSLSGSRDWVLLKYSALGVRQYVKQMHATLGAGGAESNGVSVVTDASGNVYVAGYTYGDLDGNTLIGGRDLTLTKYDSGGVKLYTRQYGAASAYSETTSAAIDTASGYIYVVGRTAGSLGTASLTGTQDAFLAQYSTAGTLNYVRQLGAANTVTSAQSVAVDGSGNVYMVGYMQDDTGDILNMGSLRAFLARYSSDGTLAYVVHLGETGLDTQALSVAVDSAGKVYVAGYTRAGLDGNTQTGTGDAFIAEYTAATGVLNHVIQFGGAGCGTWGVAVTTDAAGSVYVAGETSCGLNGNALIGTDDTFIAKYDSSRTLEYLRQLGAAGVATWPKSIAIDASGNIFVAGSTDGGLAGSQLNGITDMYVAKYNSSGTLQ